MIRVPNTALLQGLAGAAVLVVCCASLAGCQSAEGTHDTTHYPGGAAFRTYGDYFQINEGAGWKTFYAKGVNLAVAVPGKWPGDLDPTLDDYLLWFEWVAGANCNVVRLYTLHRPQFYHALGEWNSSNPGKQVYLVQGIWLDELDEADEELDYITHGTAQLDEEIRYVVDAVHGQASIPHRFGKAYGSYTHDVSNYVMSWLPGHEMSGKLVERSNQRWQAATSWDGKYISVQNGLPIEAWVARSLDYITYYELDKYGTQHPVAWSNWPALDPIHHPTETARFGQDVVDVDFGSFQTHSPFEAGIYVSFHVYPFNPEFIIYDPDYVKVKDKYGETNSYLGYLLDLKAHFPGMPVFVTEYGLPSSMGNAHRNPNAYDHGGYSETQQAQNVVTLYKNIQDSGAAGAVVFEFMDEWFKRSWMTNPTTIPAENGNIWYDLLNPEESFGMISYYPIPGQSILVDGNAQDWPGVGKELVVQSAQAVGGGDSGRTLSGLAAAADPAFVYLLVDTATSGLPQLEDSVWFIGISSYGGNTGDSRFPDVDAGIAGGRGFESMVVLDGEKQEYRLLVDDQYDPSDKVNYNKGESGVPYANDNGSYSLFKYMINNDEQYASTDLGVTKQWYYPGKLQRGNVAENSLAHFETGPGGVLEIRLPWHALWVTDPSSRQVLFDDHDTLGWDSQGTDGFRLAVVIASRGQDGALKIEDVLPRDGFSGGSFQGEVLPLYTWETWGAVSYEPRKKPLFYALGEVHGETP